MQIFLENSNVINGVTQVISQVSIAIILLIMMIGFYFLFGKVVNKTPLEFLLKFEGIRMGIALIMSIAVLLLAVRFFC